MLHAPSLQAPAVVESPSGQLDIDTHPLAAVEAFETFMGRRYDPAELGGACASRYRARALHPVRHECAHPQHIVTDGQLLRQDIFGPVALHASGRISLLSKSLEAGLRQQHRGGGGRGAAPAVAGALESPLQRFSRLSEEVRCLQEELGVVAAADAAAAAASAGGVAVSGAGGVWDSLVQGARSLEAQLAALAPALAAGQLAAGRAAGGDGEAWYEAALARLHSVETDGSGGAVRGGDEVAEPLQLPPSRRSEREELLHLDARMAALEAVLLPPPSLPGADQPTPEHSSSSSSVVGRIDALEAAVARLAASPQVLADLGMRAAAAATALRQVQAVGGETGGATAAGSASHGYVLAGERVVRAVEALERWDAWAPALPVLATRLATLERLHRDASLFTQRLALAEAALGAVEGQVSAGVELVAGAQEGLRAAAKDMAENVRVIHAAL